MKPSLLTQSLHLNQREAYGITFAAYFALNKKRHAHALLRKGLKNKSLSSPFCTELFLHFSLLLGVPMMLEGLEWVQTLSKHGRRKSKPISPKGAFRRGKATLKSIYGGQTEKLLQRLDNLHPGLARMVCTNAYGEILSRHGLSLRERELINVTVLFLQQFDAQLYSHLRGAMRVGIAPLTLQTLIRSLARSTCRPSAAALAMIKAIAGLKPTDNRYPASV